MNEIYDTLGDATGTYAGAKGALNTYFTPKRNLTFEVYNFRSITQDDEGKRNIHAPKQLISIYLG